MEKQESHKEFKCVYKNTYLLSLATIVMMFPMSLFFFITRNYFPDGGLFIYEIELSPTTSYILALTLCFFSSLGLLMGLALLYINILFQKNKHRKFCFSSTGFSLHAPAYSKKPVHILYQDIIKLALHNSPKSHDNLIIETIQNKGYLISSLHFEKYEYFKTICETISKNSGIEYK